MAQIDPENHRTAVEYYPADQKHAGQVSAVLNAEGKAQRFAYNLRGQQVGIWGETQYPIAYEYNEYGERIGMRTFHLTPDGQPGLKENEGARTTWTFHEATGSLLKKSYADGTGPEYAYDKTGQLAERKWARSHVERVLNPLAKPISPKPDDNLKITTTYTHDPVTGSPTKATYSDGSEITYLYDDSQRLAKVTDSTGSREFTYNIKGQILTETVTVSQRSGGFQPPIDQSPSAVKPLRYQITRSYYDEFCAQCAGGGTPDQPKQVTLTGLDGTDLNHQVSYEWDIRGQLAKVESPAGTFTYTYDPQNPTLLASLTAPAHKVEYEYEPHRNLITSVKNLNAQNQSVISSYAYENDILGRRTQITQRGSAFDLLQLYGQNTVQVAYNDRSEVTGYDITKLLDSAKQSSGVLPAAGQPRPHSQPKPAPQFAQTYAYDSIGNRTQFLTESGGKKADVLYESNALNQYTKLKRNGQDPEKPTHDPDGNLLEDHRIHYTWNAENRLVKVEAKDGSYTVGGDTGTASNGTGLGGIRGQPRDSLTVERGFGFIEGGDQGHFPQLFANFDLILSGKAGVVHRDFGIFSQISVDKFKQARIVQPDGESTLAEKPFIKALTTRSGFEFATRGMIFQFDLFFLPPPRSLPDLLPERKRLSGDWLHQTGRILSPLSCP